MIRCICILTQIYIYIYIERERTSEVCTVMIPETHNTAMVAASESIPSGTYGWSYMSHVTCHIHIYQHTYISCIILG